MSVLFAAVLPVILLFCGLALDVGLLELRKLQMQSAADAGALGAELEWERGTGNWVAQAQADAAVNGFANGVKNATVTAVNPPTAGDYAGYYDAIQVTVTQKVQTIFMGALSGGAVTMSATAVALVPPCSYFTGLEGSLSTYPLTIKTGNFYSNYCPIYVGTGLKVYAGSDLYGGGENVDGPSSSSAVLGTASTPPRYNAGTVSDPLASVASPSFSACNHTSYSLSSGSATLSPGTYCNGIQLTGATVTLNPGLYILTGGSHWNNSTVTGTGVTLFLTQGGGYGYGLFRIDTNSTITLSAPTDSTHGGVPTFLLFTDRNWVAQNNQDFQCNGATIAGDGIWYMTNSGLYFYNCTLSAPNYQVMDTDNLFNYNSPSTLQSDFSAINTGNPFRTRAVLVQ